MNYNDLQTLLAFYGFTIDERRRGAGNFYDLYVGTGCRYKELEMLRDQLKKDNIPSKITTVTNQDHDRCGDFYLEIPSFYCEK